jgi:hypothetical protein
VVRPPPWAVRLARAGNLDEVIFNYCVIQRTRVFDQKKRQHTFGDSAGDRSGFTTDLSSIIMVSIEELNEEDQRKYIELLEYIKQKFLSSA